MLVLFYIKKMDTLYCILYCLIVLSIHKKNFDNLKIWQYFMQKCKNIQLTLTNVQIYRRVGLTIYSLNSTTKCLLNMSFKYPTLLLGLTLRCSILFCAIVYINDLNVITSQNAYSNNIQIVFGYTIVKYIHDTRFCLNVSVCLETLSVQVFFPFLQKRRNHSLQDHAHLDATTRVYSKRNSRLSILIYFHPIYLSYAAYFCTIQVLSSARCLSTAVLCSKSTAYSREFVFLTFIPRNDIFIKYLRIFSILCAENMCSKKNIPIYTYDV